jgi:hypothetical protein
MKWEHCYAPADASVSLPRFGHSAVALPCSHSADGGCQVVIYGACGMLLL